MEKILFENNDEFYYSGDVYVSEYGAFNAWVMEERPLGTRVAKVGDCRWAIVRVND